MMTVPSSDRCSEVHALWLSQHRWVKFGGIVITMEIGHGRVKIYECLSPSKDTSYYDNVVS